MLKYLISLNYNSEIVNILGGVTHLRIRFEAYLMHVVQNLKVVGFEFIKIEENGSTFTICVKKKKGDSLKDSVIHASQCLDNLAYGIYIDNFSKNKFDRVKINVIDFENARVAGASIPIKIALKKVFRELTLEDYTDQIDFENNSA